MHFQNYIKRVRDGDLDAYSEVIKQFERPIRAWVVARCPPGGDADEVAQKTFIEAFRRIDEFQDGTEFRAWLFAIARYQLMAECTRLRRVADYHSRYAPIALLEELSRRVEKSADVDWSEKLDCLDSCLEGVNQDGRELIAYRYKDELPLQLIAEKTGRSLGAIKKSLHLLRSRLHECIVRKMSREAHS